MPYQIAVVVGSLRRDSYNRQLADALVKLAPADLSFERLRIDDLPLYNQDDDSHPAEAVTRLKREITAAHGVLFVTPEYNRSIPGVLKNAIDHASRPYGQSAWAGKPAGVIGASVGTTGTSMAQQHLRNVLAYLAMPTLGQPEAFIQVTDSYFVEGQVANPANREFLQRWITRYADWVKALAPPLSK
jgi:chromate reductase, NAD(P)H dehydrogenase (quinone)